MSSRIPLPRELLLPYPTGLPETVGVDPHTDIQTVDRGHQPQQELRHEILLFKIARVTE